MAYEHLHTNVFHTNFDSYKHFSNEHLLNKHSTLRFFFFFLLRDFLSITNSWHDEVYTRHTLSWRTLGERTLSYEVLPYEDFQCELSSETSSVWCCYSTCLPSSSPVCQGFRESCEHCQEWFHDPGGSSLTFHLYHENKGTLITTRLVASMTLWNSWCKKRKCLIIPGLVS